MNRRERRHMEKKLGITAYRKGLSLGKRMEIIQENIIEGKKKSVQIKEAQRLQNNAKEEAELKNKISSRALDLMIQDGMDFYSATEKAKEEFGQKS